MKKYFSVINEKILREFSDIKGVSIMNHVSNSYDVEMAIGFASLYCPNIVEVESCIFIEEFYNNNIDSLKKYYKTKKDIEIFVNSWSLTSLLGENDKIENKKHYIDEFAKAIQYFWKLRVDKLFPKKNIIIKIGENIMGEEGTSVTMFEK